MIKLYRIEKQIYPMIPPHILLLYNGIFRIAYLYANSS